MLKSAVDIEQFSVECRQTKTEVSLKSQRIQTTQWANQASHNMYAAVAKRKKENENKQTKQNKNKNKRFWKSRDYFGPIKWPQYFFMPIAQLSNAKQISFRHSSENHSIGLNRVVCFLINDPLSHISNGLLNDCVTMSIFRCNLPDKRPHSNNNRMIVLRVSGTLLLTGIHEYIKLTAQKNAGSSLSVNAGDWFLVKVID